MAEKGHGRPGAKLVTALDPTAFARADRLTKDQWPGR